MHPLEVMVAERIVGMCPGVEAVRFAKTGSDAVSAAVRAARAITGRDAVAVAGYHGWHDWYVGSTTRNAGVPGAVAELTRVFAYGDLPALEQLLEAAAAEGAPVAAVVLEPSGVDVPEPGYLAGVVELAHAHGALVVFDEVIVGFRVAPGGARQRYGVVPDLSCYGKALGNGMPIAAVAGRWEHMAVFEDVFFSGTHGGEALSLAAAAAVLDELHDGTVLKAIELRGTALQAGMSARAAAGGAETRIRISGEPQRTVVSFTGPEPLVDKSWVQQCFAEDGILFNGSMFVCARHTDRDVQLTLDSFERACAALSGGADVSGLLRGAPIQPVFRPQPVGER
jgi:glutamate-1-semialdehyde 2,1-aminomutase/spore coat polysaccharide biosynthesis protein SpsF